VKFDRYFNNNDLAELIQAWAKQYPDLITVSQIGSSYEKRPIWLLILTNKHTGLDSDKPALWVDANIHATEISGTTTVLNFIQHLLDQYSLDPEITNLVDTCSFYFVPRINPDGAELAMSPTPKYIRSGVRPYPWLERDDGLYPEDMDGDGRILQMRIPDPNGDWKISSLDPRLLEKRHLDEQGGNYYRLMPEGKIENFDGFIIKSAPPLQGLDFNRNFPFEWRPESEQSGAGPFPTSEPEIKALLDFLIAHPNINLAITFHTYSRVILRPYSTKADDQMETDDLWVFKKIGEIGTKLTGYRCVSTFHEFKYHPKEVTTGAFDDWIFDHLGIFCYTIELWDLPTEAGIKDRDFIEWGRDHPHQDDLRILNWIEEHSTEQGYVDWYPYQHPQLGPVELGGWNSMYTWRNPPLAFIEKESSLHVPFLISLTKMLPHLQVYSCSAEKVADQTYHIMIVIENSGFLPSYTSQQAKKRKVTKPVRVELFLSDGMKLLSGEQKQELGHLEGRSNKLAVSAHLANSITDNREKVEWVIHAVPSSNVEIKITGTRAGSLTHSIILE